MISRQNYTQLCTAGYYVSRNLNFRQRVSKEVLKVTIVRTDTPFLSFPLLLMLSADADTEHLTHCYSSEVDCMYEWWTLASERFGTSLLQVLCEHLSIP